MVLPPGEEEKLLGMFATLPLFSPGQTPLSEPAHLPEIHSLSLRGLRSSSQYPLPIGQSCYVSTGDRLEQAWAGKFLLLPALPISALPQEASATQCPQIYLHWLVFLLKFQIRPRSIYMKCLFNVSYTQTHFQIQQRGGNQ